MRHEREHARHAQVAPVPAVAQHRRFGDEVDRHAALQRIFHRARQRHAHRKFQCQRAILARGLQRGQLHALRTRGARQHCGEHERRQQEPQALQQTSADPW
jgi:hypothetical protein